MTIHIDPNADIIQQLNDLSAILSVDEVNISVSDEQMKEVKKFIVKVIGSEVNINNVHYIHLNSVRFNLSTSQQIGIDPIHLTTSQQFNGERIGFIKNDEAGKCFTTPPISTLPDAASSEGHTDK